MPREQPSLDDQRNDAFRMYVLPELEILYRVALRLTGSPHDAEDLVQDTLLRAYRAVHRFDGRYPRAWLLTILRNTNINRARKRRPQLFDDEERALETISAGGADSRDGPAEIVLEHLVDERIVAAVRSLSPDHRAVVTLVDVDGLSYLEAAEVLNVPVGTIMSRLHRARRRLRTLLEHVHEEVHS